MTAARAVRRHRRARGPDPRRIVLIVAGSVIASLLILSVFAPRGQSGAGAPAGVDRTLRAFRAGTGTFALPAAGGGPAEFVQAEALARQNGSPIAYTLFVEQEAFETRAWRDLLMVGRFPLSRPPLVDFVRELAVLVWPVRGVAPDSVMRANGFAVEDVRLEHIALHLHVRLDNGGAAPATPTGAASGVAPYGLFTIPRRQWPIPAPAPTEPPLIVSLNH